MQHHCRGHQIESVVGERQRLPIGESHIGPVTEATRGLLEHRLVNVDPGDRAAGIQVWDQTGSRAASHIQHMPSGSRREDADHRSPDTCLHRFDQAVVDAGDVPIRILRRHVSIVEESSDPMRGGSITRPGR